MNNAGSITATAPAGSPGAVDVTVTTTGGTSNTTSFDQYTYVPAPTVTGLSPTAGPTAGGTSVTITGTSFTGVSAVSFGATACYQLHGQRRQPDHRGRPRRSGRRPWT